MVKSRKPGKANTGWKAMPAKVLFAVHAQELLTVARGSSDVVRTVAFERFRKLPRASQHSGGVWSNHHLIGHATAHASPLQVQH